MVSPERLAAFALASFIIIVIPGPSVLFVIGRALAHGRRTALASVAGNALGLYVVAVCIALGLGLLVESSTIVFTIVKYAGATYLVWLGVQALRHRRALATQLGGPGTAPHGMVRSASEGFVVGVSNPKSYIMFAAVLPQFVDRPSGHIPGQMLLLSVVPFLIALVSDSSWAVTASAVRSWFARSPRRADLVGGVGGLSMIGLGLSAAMTGRKD
jgi:threonine/homoserine/homoserine lactone efflux protein